MFDFDFDFDLFFLVLAGFAAWFRHGVGPRPRFFFGKGAFVKTRAFLGGLFFSAGGVPRSAPPARNRKGSTEVDVNCVHSVQ